MVVRICFDPSPYVSCIQVGGFYNRLSFGRWSWASLAFSKQLLAFPWDGTHHAYNNHQTCNVRKSDLVTGHLIFACLSEKVKTSHAFWRNHVSSQWNILQFFLAMGLHRKIWCVSPRQSCSEVLMGAWFLDPLTLNIFAVYLWLFFGFKPLSSQNRIKAEACWSETKAKIRTKLDNALALQLVETGV